MSSLYVKHRPQTLDQVIGQDPIVKSLNQVIKARRAKSFLFSGPSGVGKTTVARIAADLFVGGKGTAANIEEFDAATNSGVEAVRNIATRGLYRAIGPSPVKCFIIDECHKLSSSAWDALLKPIEEPPEHVFWFFCTTNLGKVPVTIKTRCQKYEFTLVSEEDLLVILDQVVAAEKFDIDVAIVDAIAENSGGSPRQALVFLEECLYCETVGDALKTMRSAAKSKELIDFCRALVSGRVTTWAEASRHLKALEFADPETTRILIANYVAVVLLNTKGDKDARRLMALLECFDSPFNQSDKMAPLLLAVGRAIGLDAV